MKRSELKDLIVEILTEAKKPGFAKIIIENYSGASDYEIVPQYQEEPFKFLGTYALFKEGTLKYVDVNTDYIKLIKKVVK